MKRPYQTEDDGDVSPPKRRRLDIVTPYSNKIDLAHLSFLKRFVFDVEFCVCVKMGVSYKHSKCEKCHVQQKTDIYTKEIEAVMASFRTISGDIIHRSMYIVDVLVRELFHLGAQNIDIKQEDGDVKFTMSGIEHISSFLIQILLSRDFVRDVLIDLVSGDMTVIFSGNDKESVVDVVVHDKTMSDVLCRVKRNILSLSQLSQLQLK